MAEHHVSYRCHIKLLFCECQGNFQLTWQVRRCFGRVVTTFCIISVLSFDINFTLTLSLNLPLHLSDNFSC